MSTTVFGIIDNILTTGWVVVIGSFFSLVLCGVIYWQDTSKRSSLAFLFLGIIAFLWGLSYAFFEATFAGANAQEGIRVLYIMAAFIPVFLFLYFYSFLYEKNNIPILKFLALFAPVFLIVGSLVMYPDFIAGRQEFYGGEIRKIVFGEGFLSYAIYIFVFLIASAILLIRKYRESAGVIKVAIRRLLIAVFLTYSAALVMSLLSPFLVGGADLFWGGHIAVIFLILVMSIIIAKYNFWNIKVIATEFFVSIIVITMIAEIFFASSLIDLLIKTLITILIVFSCAFLDGSIKREIESKDKITRLLFEIDMISQQLKVLDKKKSEFLAIASHHLRDPLTTIKGYASMLMEGSYGELPLPAKEAIEKIFDSSKRLLLMVSDFMDVSRIESGDMNYSFTDVDLKKLVLGLLDEMKQGAAHAHLAFNAIIDEGVSLNVSFLAVADEGKLRQVFSNLIDNAIKYTPHGEVSLLLSKSPDKRRILFSVSDTGIGMSEATKEKIFKKFSRAEGVSKVYTEGTGLGLYVAKEIIKKHQGEIWAESKGVGHGSTFYVGLEAKR